MTDIDNENEDWKWWLRGHSKIISILIDPLNLYIKLHSQVFLFIYLGKSRKDNETMSQVSFEKNKARSHSRIPDHLHMLWNSKNESVSLSQ